MKKLLVWLLCLAMFAGMLAGCTTAPQNEATANNDGPKMEEVVPSDYVFRIGIPVNSMVEDYDENAFTKWLEEETGYNIEIVSYAAATRDYTAQVATEFQVPNNKMPDLFLGMVLGQQAINDYGVGGYLVDLAPYFEDKELSAVWWERLEELDPDMQDYVLRKMKADDGKAIYAFPSVEQNEADMIRHQAFINQEWLDKLNLPMPTNTDELYKTLVAFKNQDPNGNNEKDEIPLFGVANARFADVVSWVMNMFCYMEDARTWRVDKDGTISGFYWDEDYRKGLIFLNKLVKEGLMPDSVFTATTNDITNLINPLDGVETVGIYLGHPSLVLTKGSEAVDVYKAMPHWGNVIMDLPRNTYDNMITRDCPYPTAAWKILMTLSGKEASHRMRYGEKGIDWDDADPNTTAFTGKTAQIKVLNQSVFGKANSQTWNIVTATIGTGNENEYTQFDPNGTDWDSKKLKMQGACFNAAWDKYNADGGRPADVVMPLVYTSEEDDEVSVWRSNTNNWYKTNRADFIKGVKDPSNDAQWQAYIDGFKTNNYYDWLEVAQDVYDFTYGDKSGK